MSSSSMESNFYFQQVHASDRRNPSMELESPVAEGESIDGTVPAANQSSLKHSRKRVPDDESIKAESIPEWFGRFMQKTFFGKCHAHVGLQRNDINRYCITCDAAACRLCIASGSHEDHMVFTIYHHVYQDAVPLTQMQDYINCSKIQPFRCNKKLVVSLKPLPHTGSGSKMDENEACEICKRKLPEPGRYRFCCVACKVDAFYKNNPAANEAKQGGDEGEPSEKPIKRRRNRKWKPHRAPFF